MAPLMSVLEQETSPGKMREGLSKVTSFTLIGPLSIFMPMICHLPDKRREHLNLQRHLIKLMEDGMSMIKGGILPKVSFHMIFPLPQITIVQGIVVILIKDKPVIFRIRFFLFTYSLTILYYIVVMFCSKPTHFYGISIIYFTPYHLSPINYFHIF